MSVNDPISDMLTRVRNAGMARQAETTMPATKILIAIAKILKEEGYINDFRVIEKRPCTGGMLRPRTIEGCWKLKTKGDALEHLDPVALGAEALLGQVVYAINGQTGRVRDARALNPHAAAVASLP